MTVLHIDSSARYDGSVTRQLSAQVAQKLGGDITYRDVAKPLPHVTEAWIGANFTPADARDAAQAEMLGLSDELVAEIEAADVLVIGAPIYNFGVPAALKAWIDLIARAGRTFQYTENGPKGLMTGKRAVIVLASGGTKVGSEIDFASAYLRHIMGFIGITDVSFVTADQMMMGADEAVATAQSQIDALSA